MSWTYSGNPASSPRDALRFQIGDKNQEDQLLQDEELDFILDGASNLFDAAATACEAISASFAREVSKNIGKTKVQAESKFRAYKQLEREFRRKAATRATPYAGGTSADPSAPIFSVGLTDFSHPRGHHG